VLNYRKTSRFEEKSAKMPIPAIRISAYDYFTSKELGHESIFRKSLSALASLPTDDARLHPGTVLLFPAGLRGGDCHSHAKQSVF
jgi:hypothetical protein